MRILKENKKGITLVSLIVTVIVLLILASIATYSGINVISSSKLTTFTTELKIMQTQVNALYEEDSTKEYGDELTENIKKQADIVFTESESGITSEDGYRYWSNNLIKELGIEGVEQDFFVNLKTRSVVSYEGFQYEGKTYYTLNQLPEGLYNVEYIENTANEPTFNVMMEEISENKWRISITNIQYEGYIDKWYVNYQLGNQNYKSEDLSFVVTQKGDYSISISNGNVKSNNITVKVLTTVEMAKKMNKVFDDNMKLVDVYQNQITLPKGFKIAEDSATEVTKGIVIEDATYDGTMGSQFVWIPVGTVTGSVNGVEKTETIKLSRYTFEGDGTPTDQEDNGIYSYYQELATSDYGNATAKNIEAFKSSANENHGYYIGRYEAGVTEYDAVISSNSNNEANWTGYTGDNTQLVCKSEQQVWNYVTQNKASELSRNMYTSNEFTSDLINSYSWDTSIVFIQKFGEENDSGTYSKTVGLSSTNTNEPQNTGTNILNATKKVDKQCNIYDMAGNTWEWLTESYIDSIYPCVHRGGLYSISNLRMRSGLSWT